MGLGSFSPTFMACSIPGGLLAERWGRRQTILTGLVALSSLLVLASLLSNGSGIQPAVALSHCLLIAIFNIILT